MIDQAPKGRRVLAPARHGSVHVAAWQRQRLGHADRMRMMDAARRHERQSRQLGSGRHGGDLRQTGLRVLWTLLYRGWGRAGACDPAIAQIAEAAALARSTVQEALDRLETAGILLRIRRGLVMAGRWAQVTNVYLFRTPMAWLPASDTESRSPLESKIKPHQESILWEGTAAQAPVADPSWLQAKLNTLGWQEMTVAAT